MMLGKDRHEEAGLSIYKQATHAPKKGHSLVVFNKEVVARYTVQDFSGVCSICFMVSGVLLVLEGNSFKVSEDIIYLYLTVSAHSSIVQIGISGLFLAGLVTSFSASSGGKLDVEHIAAIGASRTCPSVLLLARKSRFRFRLTRFAWTSIWATSSLQKNLHATLLLMT